MNFKMSSSKNSSVSTLTSSYVTSINDEVCSFKNSNAWEDQLLRLV